MAVVPPPSATPDPEEGRRRQKYVLAGLFLTLIGLALVGLALPTAPGALARALPDAAAGLLGLWIGGILLGNVLRPVWKARPRRRAPPTKGETGPAP
ncbi:MAG: hypothetical protein ACREC5_05725 [Thermoplasmata archaeon]